MNEEMLRAPEDMSAPEPAPDVSESEPTQVKSQRAFRKSRTGVVVSNKMDKTIVVAIEDRVRHPLYKKIVKRTYKLKAHDEQNACNIGDRVRVMETRPLSRDKRWRVVEILEKAK
jgi:small subunit ribosomal protein S17